MKQSFSLKICLYKSAYVKRDDRMIQKKFLLPE